MGVAYLEDIINTIFKKPETLHFFRTVCERFIQLPVMRSHLNLYHMCYNSYRPPLVAPYVWYMRLLKQIEGVLQKMTAEYDKLTVLLSEATVNPALFDGPLGCTIPSLHGCFIVHEHDDHMGSLQGLFGLVQGIGSLRSRRAMSRARSWMYR